MLLTEQSAIATFKLYPVEDFSIAFKKPERKKVGQQLNRIAFSTLHLVSMQWFFWYLQIPIKLDIKNSLILREDRSV